MPYVDSDGVRLYYEAYGSGEAIVFVHEFAGDVEAWEPQLRHFSRRWRCVAFNARGYPPSDVPETAEAYTQAIVTDDVARLMRHLGIARAHVVGLSMGSFTTLHFGLRYPEMALSLVMAGTGYGALPQGRAEFHAQIEPLAALYEREGAAAAAESLAANPSRQPFRRKDPRGWEADKQRLARHSAVGMARTLRGVQLTRPGYPDLEAELSEMRLPVLLIVGDDDEPSLEPSLYLKRLIASAALAVFPDSGHAVNLEEPGLFNRVVEDFLSTVAAGRWRTGGA